MNALEDAKTALERFDETVEIDLIGRRVARAAYTAVEALRALIAELNASSE